MTIFDFEPNWKDKVNIGYTFLTSVKPSKLLKEQRKAFFTDLKRTESFSVDLASNADRLFNTLQMGNSVPFYLPIFTEALIPDGVGNLQGLDVIPVNDFTNYYNLNNLTTQLMLVDLTRAEKSEIVTISSLATPNINLDAVISGLFPLKTTVVYPIMLATCSAKRVSDVTDGVTSYDLEFSEYF